jgi:hypothetical protein
MFAKKYEIVKNILDKLDGITDEDLEIFKPVTFPVSCPKVVIDKNAKTVNNFIFILKIILIYKVNVF